MAVRKAAFEDVGGLDEGMSDVHVCGIVGEDVGGLDEGMSDVHVCGIVGEDVGGLDEGLNGMHLCGIIVGERGHGVTACVGVLHSLFCCHLLFILLSFVLLPPLHFPLLLVQGTGSSSHVCGWLGGR